MQLKHLFYSIFFFTGITPLFYYLNRHAQRILNYHHILPGEQIKNNLLSGYSHSIDSFEKQLQIISNKFRITTKVGISGTVVITFDDGALNNIKYALPVLEKFNIKSYFFVVASQINNRDMLWIDKWFLWLSEVPEGSYQILGNAITIKSDQERIDMHRKLWNYLKEDYSEKDVILESMQAAYSFEHFANFIREHKDRLCSMTEDDLEKLKKKGHFIGFHSSNHDLLNLLPENTLRKQLEEVKTNTHYNTMAFAIPFGTDDTFDENVISILLQKGFSPLFLNQQEAEGENVYGRMNLPDTGNRYEIHAHLSGMYHFIKTRKLL